MCYAFDPSLTVKQLEALNLIKAKEHTLLFGGARSGKTFLAVCVLVVRALLFPGSRHLICRYRFNHAKVSIWCDTLPKILALLPPRLYRKYDSDHYIKFWNGSEIWIDGLDDKIRVEKILGREYNTIFFNEISMIPYDSVQLALTRLSLMIEGCRNYAIYDCNPTAMTHWAYKLFIQGMDPTTGVARPDFDDFGTTRLNPTDNREHLAKGYIEKTLENLTAAKQKRFLLGEWSEVEGVVFDNWDIIDEIPEEVKSRREAIFGLDFGFSVDPAALVECYLMGDDLYVDERIYQTDTKNAELFRLVRAAVPGREYVRADSQEGKTIAEFYDKGLNIIGARKGPDSVRFGIEWLKGKRIYVTRRSINIQNELKSYCYKQDKNGRRINEPIDDFNHAIDAIRYACEEYMREHISQDSYSAGSLGL